MARRKKDSLSVFSTALDEFGFNNTSTQEGTSNLDDIITNSDIDNLDENNDDETDNDEGVIEVNSNTGNARDDDSEIPDNILNNSTSTEDLDDENELNDPDGQHEEINENERSQVGMFFDAFAEELGWDVSDEDRPDNIEDLVYYIGQVVEQNSRPQFADNRIAELDQYVRNGGKFEDFYQMQQQLLSYDSMDMEDESNQRAAVRDYLRIQGYDDESINRKIDRYEDSDMLEEEAQDAIARLQQIRQTQLQQQQEQQEQLRQAQEAQMQEFMSNLTNSISSLDNIRGIQIPKADRKELFDYITKVDADGLTKYQRDFNGNLVNNLIESAYFTMKGDTLLGEATRSGRTSAANKLRTMLRHQSTNHSRYNVNEDKQRSVVDIASQFYR